MRVALIAAANVGEGSATPVDFFGRRVLVVRNDGHVRAFMDVCAHLGGPLKLNDDGTGFTCEWHGACFDARSGRATCGPARPDSRLIRLPTTIDDGQVTYVYGEADRPRTSEA